MNRIQLLLAAWKCDPHKCSDQTNEVSAKRDSTPPVSGSKTHTQQASQEKTIMKDPITTWEAIVETCTQRCAGNKRRGISLAVKENPVAHQEYLRAYNQRHASR
ncbi:hypothetical protein KOR42_48070 [Thalassoglobus neptunius]|uniref:Uncharacterized protein n=2 Tax=Thalassoglobus neptunius TaxID=1938619 RepID=A0A5C5VS75_9PLAN|nr:hypothetical protein KOR42_48070 [Thalassoglobus neptunius]